MQGFVCIAAERDTDTTGFHKERSTKRRLKAEGILTADETSTFGFMFLTLVPSPIGEKLLDLFLSRFTIPVRL